MFFFWQEPFSLKPLQIEIKTDRRATKRETIFDNAHQQIDCTCQLSHANQSYYYVGRLWQKTRTEVFCCYVSHHPTVLSPLSCLRCDNQKLVYFLVNSSHLYVLSCKFISRITLTFRFNLTSHAEYYFMWSITPCYILSKVSHAFGVSSPVSHLLSILISYVTLSHLLLPCSNFGDWDQPLSPNMCDTSDNIHGN